MSALSKKEQSAGAGPPPDETLVQLARLNTEYEAKFGFIFIMAVKGSNRHQILAAFEERMNNSQEQEFARALAEINKIALFRLQAM